MATTFASPPQRTFREPAAARRRPRARYTVDGSDALEEHLEESCERVKQAVLGALPWNMIEGLLLGGGYGRGEGGVLRDTDGEHPYNDLEFYLFVRGNRHIFEARHHDTLRHLSHDLSNTIGIEIEFKVLTTRDFCRAPISMFFYDMMAGHKWLIGSSDLFAYCDHHRAAHLLPISEASRLLMNRCSGLLFAREQEQSTDFIRRNIRKAELAFGDAVLAAFGRYHWSCRERHNRLENFSVPLPWRAELVERHRRGLEFKLHPFRSDELLVQLTTELNTAIAFAGALWLWLESQRLRHSFISARHYATSPIPKWPDSSRARNVLLNLKLFRRPVIRGVVRHPRERIVESLSLLLWEPAALADSSLRDLLQSNLRASLSNPAVAVRRYRELWSHVG
jgi:hypothetical protein